jgi:hypothetical protein
MKLAWQSVAKGVAKWSLLLPTLLLNLGLLALAGTYGTLLVRRPARVNVERPLFEGIHYQRQARDQPRPLVFHIVTIDLTTPGIELVVTPPRSRHADWETTAQTTAAALRQHQFQLAINGSFFFPYREKHPLNVYPRAGDDVNVVGLAMADGQTYSAAEPDWLAFCILENSDHAKVEVRSQSDCPPGTQHALAGRELIVKDNQALEMPADGDHDRFFPRTVIATDRQRQTLWLVLVDGRQPDYSEGMTLPEMSQFLIGLGADRALNLDGGGSTTLVMQQNQGVRTLNAPIHTNVPLRQRPIANHIGIYAPPLDD